MKKCITLNTDFESDAIAILSLRDFAVVDKFLILDNKFFSWKQKHKQEIVTFSRKI